MYLLDYKNDGETDYILIKVVYEGSGRFEDEFFFKKIGPEEYEYIDQRDAFDISYDYFYDYNDKVYGLNEYKNNCNLNKSNKKSWKSHNKLKIKVK